MSSDFFGAGLVRFLFSFVFYYPFLMAFVWMCGGVAHAFFFERDRHLTKDPLSMLDDMPLVSVIVPCYNEGSSVVAVIEQIMRSRYPNFEVLAVNDGSTDDTGAQLDALAVRYSRLRVLHNASNQGKAVGLNTAALLAQGEFILGVDGDALVDPDAIGWMMRHMQQSKRVGAITGNPRIRTRTSLLGRMQVGEFSSTIGLIKRTQQLIGRLFTVSGVLSMFRKSALLDVGFWSPDVMTEDIDISWKLQLKGWDVRFEPRALCWILMPEKVLGLYRQRQRWATGGAQTLLRHGLEVLHPKHIRMWPIFVEYLASVIWAYVMFCVLILSIFKRLLPPEWQVVGFLPEWNGMLLGATCMLQMLISLWIDRHYDRNIMRYLVWTVWYPIAFWMINMFTTVFAIPITLLRRRGKRAVWTSPDREQINVN